VPEPVPEAMPEAMPEAIPEAMPEAIPEAMHEAEREPTPPASYATLDDAMDRTLTDSFPASDPPQWDSLAAHEPVLRAAVEGQQVSPRPVAGAPASR
jgi:hypothetical protein